MSNIIVSPKEVSFSYEVEGPLKGKTLKVALVLDKESTYVSRGENRKRTLENTNIVIQEVEHVIPKGAMGEARIKVPEWVDPSKQLSLIAYVQDENLNIYGVAQTDNITN